MEKGTQSTSTDPIAKQHTKHTLILGRSLRFSHLDLKVCLGGEIRDLDALCYFLEVADISAALETIVVRMKVGGGNDVFEMNVLTRPNRLASSSKSNLTSRAHIVDVKFKWGGSTLWSRPEGLASRGDLTSRFSYSSGRTRGEKLREKTHTIRR